MIVGGVDSVINLAVGVGGSGKSYLFGAMAAIQAVQNQTRTLYTSIGLKFEPWTDSEGNENLGLYAYCEKYLKADRETVDRYVKQIPRDIVGEWVPSRGGAAATYAWFNSQDLAGCDVVIDEAHKYCPKKCSVEHFNEWEKLLGEMRKHGCKVYFVTQVHSKLNKTIDDHSKVHYHLEKGSLRLDGVFGIRMDYWYNLQTLFGIPYLPRFVVTVQRDQGGKKVTERERWFTLDLKKAQVYDTAEFAADADEEELMEREAAKEERPAFQRYSKFGLLLWFARDNWSEIIMSPIAFRLFLVSVGIALVLFWPGGIGGLFKSAQDVVVSAISRKAPKGQGDLDEKSEGEETPDEDPKDLVIEALQERLDSLQRQRRVYYARVGNRVLLADGWHSVGSTEGLAKDAKLQIDSDGVVSLGSQRLFMATPDDYAREHTAATDNPHSGTVGDHLR